MGRDFVAVAYHHLPRRTQRRVRILQEKGILNKDCETGTETGPETHCRAPSCEPSTTAVW